jgi:hypothetical protein
MDAKDELRELWCSQSSTTATTREELVMLVQKKTRRFDRLVLIRNLFESVAALAVAVLFAAMAAHAPTPCNGPGCLSSRPADSGSSSSFCATAGPRFPPILTRN